MKCLAAALLAGLRLSASTAATEETSASLETLAGALETLALDQCTDNCAGGDDAALELLQRRTAALRSVGNDGGGGIEPDSSTSSVVNSQPCGHGGPCRRVLVLRHCSRSTEVDEHAQAYSSRPYPDYNTGYMWCTPGGVQVAQHMGVYLKSNLNITNENTRFVFDDYQRDGTTAHSLARGMSAVMNQGVAPMQLNQSAFALGPCSFDDTEAAFSEAKARMMSEPLPGGLGKLGSLSKDEWSRHLQALRDIVGVGEIDIMTLNPPSTADLILHRPKLKIQGSAEVLAHHGQQMLMAMGSGEGHKTVGPVKFGNATLQEMGVSVDTVLNYAAWVFWSRHVTNVRNLLSIGSLKLGSAVLEALQSPQSGGEPQGNVIFVGHDTSMDKLRALFDITWEAPPFSGSPGVTPPVGGLMFSETSHAGIQIDFIYPELTGHVQPPIRMLQATPGFVTLEDLKRRAAETLAKYPMAASCAEKLGISFA